MNYRNRLSDIKARLFHSPHVPYGAILMLHRVDTPNTNGIWYNEHLKISSMVIEEMVTYARSRGCEFVSLEEITREHHLWEQPRKQIALTLDDGYRDNYVNGAPTFRKLKVPYCIYVCTKMIKGEMLYWWEILEQLCIQESRIEITQENGSTQIFDSNTKEKKELAFLDIRNIILKLPQEELLEKIMVLFSRYDINYNYGNDKLGLTWNQVKELVSDPLCTIGNHTYSHKAFTGCTDKAIKLDINQAAEDIKTHTGYKMCHFAFPFGEENAVSQQDIELVKEIGFKTSATTRDGLICYGSDRLELPRIFLTEQNWREVIDRIISKC